MITMKSDKGEEYEFEPSFFYNIEANNNFSSSVYTKQVPVKIMNLINGFYTYHYKGDNVKYLMLDKPLKYTEFEKNIQNKWDYEFINHMSIIDVNNLFDIVDSAGIFELEDLCAAKLADYYKKITMREMQERYLIYKSTITDDDLKQIIEVEPELKELIKSIEEPQENIN
jgi:hypothetical protein